MLDAISRVAEETKHGQHCVEKLQELIVFVRRLGYQFCERVEPFPKFLIAVEEFYNLQKFSLNVAGLLQKGFAFGIDQSEVW